jgi:fatty acid-binding protein DegV
VAGVRVVTDSACDLTEELAALSKVTVVPLTIRFGAEELLARRAPPPADFGPR